MAPTRGAADGGSNNGDGVAVQHRDTGGGNGYGGGAGARDAAPAARAAAVPSAGAGSGSNGSGRPPRKMGTAIVDAGEGDSVAGGGSGLNRDAGVGSTAQHATGPAAAARAAAVPSAGALRVQSETTSTAIGGPKGKLKRTRRQEAGEIQPKSKTPRLYSPHVADCSTSSDMDECEEGEEAEDDIGGDEVLPIHFRFLDETSPESALIKRNLNVSLWKLPTSTLTTTVHRCRAKRIQAGVAGLMHTKDIAVHTTWDFGRLPPKLSKSTIGSTMCTRPKLDFTKA
ncbi:hypothetical protein PHYPSEUDO_012388 [Phytophthora pseudosyringae]|uniref:Uncharacterized protein n=1 Tax=Phytophthora pseudosyringae TaxID=221518 RepID=A0A8T1V6Q2_9STRA|nr:hypothetical protein PHYPSEUDO_012388 [Phytophthora pseudosyringae]